MDAIQTYILRIVAVALLCGICHSFFDGKSAIGTIVHMVTGLLLAITVLSPIVKLQIDDFTGYLSGIQADTETMVADGEQAGQRERARIITEQCEAYILDKADSLGLTIQVQVQLTQDDSMHPESIALQGAASPYAKSVLREYITDSLGIPEEKQIWSTN